MKTSELLKLFKKNGIYFLEHGARHDVYYSPITGKTILVWRHAKEIPIGTCNAMLKAAGLK